MREDQTSIREANLIDTLKIETLLRQTQLSADDILADGTRYWLAEKADGSPIGVVGLELGHGATLLRSVAVSPSFQGQGWGMHLVQWALDAATRAGYQYAYLFSTQAGTYWQRLKFQKVPVSELVAALPEAPQVKRYELLGWLPTEVAWRRDLK
ncbi:GNAT family N-acetyltransferase [Dictyobacter sp. S3.2.2.5]|uniref:GNAT family N-acetyltransferase n=1 Tax=Dictyobacter halimunensis TaxID=3026934 RepID=A0ABQ6FQE2_9CHLR|nr:GNAT family N-acetyltransferase [Dictyobacter sp. S3.2.2.5]